MPPGSYTYRGCCRNRKLKSQKNVEKAQVDKRVEHSNVATIQWKEDFYKFEDVYFNYIVSYHIWHLFYVRSKREEATIQGQHLNIRITNATNVGIDSDPLSNLNSIYPPGYNS